MTGEMILADRFALREVLALRTGVRLLRCHDQQRDASALVAEVETSGEQAQQTITTLSRQVRGMTHDGLVPLIDAIVHGDQILLVAEDPGGQTLAQVLRAGPLAEETVLNQTIALLHTIEALHTQKPPLVLGEPTPDSILVLPSGEWRLLPHDLATPLNREATIYRAPELQDAEPNPASDLYGLTAVLHEALTGQPPQFAGEKLTAPRSLRPDLSALTEQALLRGLQSKIANRYQVAREMRLTLETVRMMAGRSLGLGPDATAGGVVSTPAPATQPTQPVTFEVPSVVAAPEPTPAIPVAPAAKPDRSPLLTGCLVVVAAVLVLAACAICALLAAFIFGPLQSTTSVGSTANVPTLVPTSEGATLPTPTLIAGGSPAPTLAPIPTPIVPLSPNAITLTSAPAITQTSVITASVFGPVAFSSDGATLAIGVGDRISLVNPNTLDEIAALRAHTGSVSSLAFSPDGSVVASGASDDRAIYLWDARSGTPQRAISGHDGGWTRSLAFSPDGTLLASGGTDGTVRIWDAASGTQRQILRGHTGFLGGVAFSPDGTRLASGSRDGTVRLWDVASGTPVAGFAFETPLSGDGVTRYWTTGVAFSPDGTQLAVGATDGSVYQLDPATGAIIRELRGHTNWIVLRGIVYTADSSTLFSAALDGTIRMWNAASGAEIAVLQQHQRGVFGISVTGDGTRMASTSDQEGRMLLWDVTQRSPINSLRVGLGMPTDLGFSQDNAVLATTGYNGVTRLQILGTNQTRLLIGSTSSVQTVAFLPNGRLSTLTDQDTVILVDIPNGTERPLTGLSGSPLAIASAPDGSFVVAGNDAGDVVVWDATSGTTRATFDTDLSLVSRIAISSDGSLVAFSGAVGDPGVEIWDTRSGQRARAITVTSEAISVLAFQPGQQRLGISSTDGALRVVNAADGVVLQTITAAPEQGWFAGADFSPDGTLIATATPSGSVQLWETATGNELVRIEAPSALTSVAFAPDGASFVVGGRNGQVYQYAVPTS